MQCSFSFCDHGSVGAALAILGLGPRLLFAQNLVPNPDFETHTLCPGGTGRIEYAIPWLDPGENSSLSGKSDYFHVCATAPEIWVPNNFVGFQVPHSGEAHAGSYSFHSASPDYREFIMVPLLAPLQAGKCYHFSMYVNLANASSYAIASMGVHFSDTALVQNTGGPIPVIPHLDGLGGLLSDTTNWTEVSGYYTAQGGEAYLTIGNFHYDATTTGLLIDSTFAWWYSYYYFDDVSLVPVEDGYGATGIPEEAAASVSWFPNPVVNDLVIRSEVTGATAIIVRDAAGRVVIEKQFNTVLVLPMGDLPSGVYLCELRDPERTIARRRILKQ